MPDSLTDRLISTARSLGAASVGVASVAPFERELSALEANRASGRSGPLHFVYDDPITATTITSSFPWAENALVVGWDYAGQTSSESGHGAVVARFATADHYEHLRRITSAITEQLGEHGYKAEVLIDDNRLVDRAAAVRAGVGWWGKSTMVLAPGHGPWMLLGSVVTDAPLDVTPPMRRGCGTCVACFPACPTGALSDIGLDARRCLSTWLQSRGSIPHWIRPLLGRRIYGCDDCLTSCPPGFGAIERSRPGTEHYRFTELLALDDEALLDRFNWWYIPMRSGRYIRRNLLIAAGNSRESDCTEPLSAHLEHPSSMIRGVAAWSLARSVGESSADRLAERLAIETAPETRDELALARMMVLNPDLYRDYLALDEWANTTS